MVAVSGGTYEPWTPPSDLGSMPEGLQERAFRVLDAQSESMAMIALQKGDAASHLRALGAGTGSSRPIFLDARA